MADTNDTIDGLLAEAIAHADEVAGDCGTACKREHKQLADWLKELRSRRSAERGDCAKLREALVSVKRSIDDMGAASLDGDPEVLLMSLTQVCARLSARIDSALSAPPRNCDVGTPKEQDERFHKFCIKHRTGSCAGCCRNPVGDYTVANGIRECALVWAQAPYTEGGAK